MNPGLSLSAQPEADASPGSAQASKRHSLLPSTAAIAALVLVLASCGIDNDGPRTTQTRNVADFSRIDNPSSVDVRLRVGEPQRLRVSAGENIIDNVHTEVHKGTLRVTFEHHGFGGGNVVLYASVPELTDLDVSGSGDTEADVIDADALEIGSNGSGDIVVGGIDLNTLQVYGRGSGDIALNGRTERLTVGLDGTGGADLAGLTAREARVSVRGSGDADVRAEEQLDVSLDGSGDVRYHGDPALTQHIDGSGELSRQAN